MLAPVVTIVSTLLALGIITPFGKGDALADSRARTLEAGTSKLRIDVQTGRERPLRYVATGAFDYREDRGTVRYNLTRIPGLDAAAAAEARFFQNVAFLRVPDPSRPRRPWMLIDLEEDPALIARAARTGGRRTADLGAVPAVRVEDPTRILAELDADGDVDDLGTDRELGVELHKYRGTLGSANGRRAVTATAWIDDSDLIRRLELTRDGGSSTTTMSFYDFGAPVDTRPPPDREVVLLADVLREQIRRGAP